MTDPCSRCDLLHAKWVPCSVAIEAAKEISAENAPALLKAKSSLQDVMPELLQKPERTFRKKKKMGAAARKILSDKAKAFWANKRAEKAAADT